MPVVIEGRKIARSFWGKAWCDNLERYSDFANRLPRGRAYVSNGSVVDLQLAHGKIEALVSGTEIYRVKIDISVAAPTRWKAICADCAGSVGSLVELLQGKLSKHVMERVCREADGLFPGPREITMTCSCPDWAGMCKHVAATLYGVGARLELSTRPLVHTSRRQPGRHGLNRRPRFAADRDARCERTRTRQQRSRGSVRPRHCRARDGGAGRRHGRRRRIRRSPSKVKCEAGAVRCSREDEDQDEKTDGSVVSRIPTGSEVAPPHAARRDERRSRVGEGEVHFRQSSGRALVAEVKGARGRRIRRRTGQAPWRHLFTSGSNASGQVIGALARKIDA